MSDFFTIDTVRLILTIIFGAFLVFYLLYGFFAIYHAIKYGFKGDKLTYPALIIFLAGSVVLVAFTVIYLGIF
ncbi:MAG: hypothetical protein U0517_01850 [Candidatus Andersenbacteria bacterium]